MAKKAFKVVLGDKTGFQRVLKGSPQTTGMKSGQLILLPGESVGKHDTADREEALLIIEGQALVSYGKRGKIKASALSVIYIPPRTEHDVLNSGKDVLRYVYVVTAETIV